MSSTTKIDDGGPAFPVTFHDFGNGQAIYPEQGMALRDYFAAKSVVHSQNRPTALWQRIRGLLGLPYTSMYPDPDGVARYAYMVADAMLKARQQ